MITKKELMFRICDNEANYEWLVMQFEELDKRVKKLEPKKVIKKGNK